MVQPIWKPEWKFQKYIKSNSAIRSGNPTSGYLSKIIEIKITKKIFTTMFLSIIHYNQDIKTTQLSMGR